MTEQETGPDRVVDWSAGLEATGGDESLLIELAQVFLDESTSLVAQIRQAIDQQDFVLLNRAGHTLKGGLRIFASRAAMERAEELESMARELANDFRDVQKGRKNASVITPERIAAAFAEAPRVAAELEPCLDRVVAAIKTRLACQAR